MVTLFTKWRATGLGSRRAFILWPRAVALSVLVTGGAGYIGSTLVPMLLHAGHRVLVVDRFYFGEESLHHARERFGDRLRLVRADVRRLSPSVWQGIEAVVDLAGISNDPSCELDPALTRAINLEGCKATMQAALRAGVSRYVLASSCSVYGRGEGVGLTESSGLNPVSLYAKCKAEAERALLSLPSSDMCPTVLRFATVFGLSPRMRFDLAVNVMTKNAYTQGRITVDGGGQQWRPFVHVSDVADVVRLMLEAEPDKVRGQVFNVGHDSNNVRILNLAYRVRDAVSGTQIVMAPTDPDLRDYNVRFDKLASFAPDKTFKSIDHGVAEVLEALRTGAIDPFDRRWYTLEQYRFLAEVERTFHALAIDGRVLS